MSHPHSQKTSHRHRVGAQQFAFAVNDGPTITANPDTPDVNGSIEELNHAAGVHCDETTCASSGENEPFDLRYVVDTIFDDLPPSRN